MHIGAPCVLGLLDSRRRIKTVPTAGNTKLALAPFSDLVADAAGRGEAVGAFTCYNLEQALGVLLAAEERSRGVVLLVGESSFSGPGGGLLMAALVAVATRSDVAACVQLDHVSDLATIEAALEAGVGAVMADGSKLPFAGNVVFTRAAVEAAARRGAHIEAELGGIEGDEDVATAVAAGALTDPDEAAAYVEQTGVACLAVSIGNVHGVYRKPPALDWPRLQAIQEAVPIPLSLHGASGLPNADVERAISLGVAKVNVNTELRQSYLAATAARLSEARPGARVLDLNQAQTAAVAEVVRAKLDALIGPEQQ